MKLRRIHLSTTHMIMLSFLGLILLGSFLLALPIATKSGEAVPYPDALFTATTSACVTGLVTVSTAATWSVFGQIVILLLIQVGGLGVITVMTGFMLALNRKMGLSDRLLLQDAFNLNTLSGLIQFVKKVILGTFFVEGAGALLYMIVFVPKYGLAGIWYSIFNAVSAFCNAGMDLLGENSLADYVTHPLVGGVTSALVILGGLGFIVWWDLISVFKDFGRKKLKCLRYLTLHSKIALVSTAVLLFGGMLVFLVLEYDNPQTLGELSFGGKLQASFFQSMTTRTAGFYTVSQPGLTQASAMVSIVLMLIGGSPVGTAGGMKTVTAVVLFATASSAIKNKNHVSLFGRRLSGEAVRKAVAVTVISLAVLLVSTVALLAVTDASLTDVMYETASAVATVGLTRDLTPTLDLAGKLIIIVTMYLGRVGHLSLALAFNKKQENHNLICDPVEEISVG